MATAWEQERDEMVEAFRKDARAPVVDEGYINKDECWVGCDCFRKYLDGPREPER